MCFKMIKKNVAQRRRDKYCFVDACCKFALKSKIEKQQIEERKNYSFPYKESKINQRNSESA